MFALWKMFAVSLVRYRIYFIKGVEAFFISFALRDT